MAEKTNRTGLITQAEVAQVAKLAHLTLSDAETARMQRDLSSILEYMAKLNELDTSDTETTAHAVELPTKLREDVVRPGLPIAKALANAPERIDDGFGVPKIIE